MFEAKGVTQTILGFSKKVVMFKNHSTVESLCEVGKVSNVWAEKTVGVIFNHEQWLNLIMDKTIIHLQVTDTVCTPSFSPAWATNFELGQRTQYSL